MASATYKARVIVLRKTKLGETDLILTMLAEDGSQIRSVAKGARKPASPFSSRLELYAVSDVLLSAGRGLDIVKEARLVEGNEKIRTAMERAVGAAAMTELLDKVTQLGLANPTLFNLTTAALDRLSSCPESAVPSVSAAHLLKTLAFSGLRPSLGTCVSCGETVDLGQAGATVFLSYSEGGILCSACSGHVDTMRVSAALCGWVDVLLKSTFDQIIEYEIDLPTSFELLQFCQSWVREHVGVNLKSLQFMFSCDLYGYTRR